MNSDERKDFLETAHFQTPLPQIKLAPSATDMSFSGYGAVFDNVDGYGDVIAKGAFLETIARAKSSNQWPPMLMQHGGEGLTADDMTPIGIWTEMEEDEIGLRITGKLADTPRGREAYALLKMDPRPAITGLSIGYIAKAFEPRSRPEDPRRKLTKIDLMEVSLVTFPANSKARVQNVKSATIRAAEQALREAGLSRDAAKAILAHGWKGNPQREAGEKPTDELAEALRRNIATLTL